MISGPKAQKMGTPKLGKFSKFVQKSACVNKFTNSQLHVDNIWKDLYIVSKSFFFRSIYGQENIFIVNQDKNFSRSM